MKKASSGEAWPAEAADYREMQVINERLVIASIRQQELAESAAQAERRAQATLEMLQVVHEELTATHEQLQVTLAVVRVAYERERLIAEVLQRSLTQEVPENAFAGISVATLYEAALAEAEVGGDFFDIFAMPRNRVAIAISDASGKGLSAAVRTMQLKDVIRAFTREYPYSPAAIVARLNDFVCDNQHFDLDKTRNESFACLTLALLDPQTGQGSLVSAGCEPALIVRANGAAEVLDVSGMPLGILREEIYTVISFHLATGDTLVLVTDGITEARRGEEFLQYEGMVTLAQEALTQPRPSLREAAELILKVARSFGGSLRDDACIVLVRLH